MYGSKPEVSGGLFGSSKPSDFSSGLFNKPQKVEEPKVLSTSKPSDFPSELFSSKPQKVEEKTGGLFSKPQKAEEQMGLFSNKSQEPSGIPLFGGKTQK